MSKHTPGPWRLNRRFCFNVEDQNGRTIARINFDHETYDEAMANARLIAAAPDLLAATEAALALLQADIPDNWRDRVCGQLQTAIAKARGEVIG